MGESSVPPPSAHLTTTPKPLPLPQIDELDKDNPFEGDHDNELTKKVREYSQTDPALNEHFGLFKNGALLAQDEKYALTDEIFLSSLSEKQKLYLEPDEKTKKSVRKLKRKNKRPMEDGGFWDQSKYLKGSLLSACLAGIIQYVLTSYILLPLQKANTFTWDGPNQVCLELLLFNEAVADFTFQL